MSLAAVIPMTVAGSSVPLTERALTARLYIQCPSFRKTDKKIAKKVAEDTGGRAEMHSHYRSLLAKGAIKSIQSIIGEARTYHYDHTLPWEDEGVRVLPTAMFEEYMKAMRGFERRFNAEVAKFKPNYPALIEEAKPLLGDAFNENDYPHPMDIDKKFTFRVKTNELSTDFRCSSIGAEEEARIRADVQERVQEALAGTVRNLFEQVHEHVSHMVERLNAYNEREERLAKADEERLAKPAEGEGEEQQRDLTGTFRDSLVTNLREFVERLPGLNITGDVRIEEMRVKLLRQLCPHEPEDLRKSPGVRNDVLKQAAAIQAAVSELI
jgi:hypothetical protein